MGITFLPTMIVVLLTFGQFDRQRTVVCYGTTIFQCPFLSNLRWVALFLTRVALQRKIRLLLCKSIVNMIWKAIVMLQKGDAHFSLKRVSCRLLIQNGAELTLLFCQFLFYTPPPREVAKRNAQDHIFGILIVSVSIFQKPVKIHAYFSTYQKISLLKCWSSKSERHSHTR